MTTSHPENSTATRSTAFRLRDWLAPVLVLCLVVTAWQMIVWFGRIHPVLLPGPIAVAQSAWKLRHELITATGRTALAAAAGLGMSIVMGTLLAFIFSQSTVIRRALYPYAVLLQTIPIIAIAPILIVSLGRGFLSVSLVSCVISLFPIITNTTTGLARLSSGLNALLFAHARNPSIAAPPPHNMHIKTTGAANAFCG